MAGNIFGTLFRVSSFGESHGPAVGCTIDGCPAGIAIDVSAIAKALARRRPGNSPDTAAPDGLSAKQATEPRHGAKLNPISARNEPDEPRILSGIFEGKTTGAPISILIVNHDTKPSDYAEYRGIFRAGHGDYGWSAKYGVRDHRGGGRLSGRETAARVAAGAVALAYLSDVLPDIELWAYTLRAGGVSAPDQSGASDGGRAEIERNAMRAPDMKTATAMLEAVAMARAEGDSVGGIVECRVRGMPPGLGDPVFEGLDAALAAAMLSIPGVKGFEIGAGFGAADMRGSRYLDPVLIGPPGASPPDGLALPTLSYAKNDAGGVTGGISTGADLVFRAAIKPVPTIASPLSTMNEEGQVRYISGASPSALKRHDACLCPRIVPVVEAMTALVLADAVLLSRVARAHCKL